MADTKTPVADANIKAKVRHLLELAKRGATDAEKAAAQRQADLMIAKYKLKPADLEPPAPPKPKPQNPFVDDEVEFDPSDPFATINGSMANVAKMRAAHEARKKQVVGYVKTGIGKLVGIFKR